MKRLFHSICLLLVCGNCFAIDYYVSSSMGSNSNDGKSPDAPFETIDKVNSIMSMLMPGDRVLFRRGDVFRGQINVSKSGTPASKIIFGAYGTGEKPVISGAKLVNASNWTNLGNGFWQASHLDKITHLFKNEQIQISARFPNAGYININSTNGVREGNATITSTALSQPAGFWTGATVHVRNQGDAITKSTISGSQSNTIQFPGTGYQIVQDFGFYIDNSENALDAEGEWFWNETTKTLKIKSSADPSQFQFDGSFYDHAFKLDWSVSNITIQDLKFSCQTKSAVSISYSSNVTLQNNFFKNCLNGVRADGYTDTEVLNLQIVGNVFHDILNSSIATNPWVNQMTISNNEIKRNSIIPGYEESCLTCGQAVSLAGSGALVSNNRIEDCGYAAINYVNSNHVIEKNWIKKIGLSKNDCGAIQSWGSMTTNNIIRNNFCSEISGNIEGMPSSYGIIANGIYLDNYQSGSTIEYNTCFDSPNATGIFIYSARDNVVRFNTAYNNAIQISIAERNPTTPPGNEQAAFYVLSTNNTITDNIGYCLTEKQKAVTTYSDYLGTANFGTFDRNLWFNPYWGTIATDMGKDYTLSGWRTAMNRDMQSSEHFLRISPIESVVTTGNNLIANGNFNTNGNGWSTWQGHVSLTVGQNPDFGSSVLNFTGNSGGAQNYANLQSPNFSVDGGAKYLLRFKGKSTNHHMVSVQNAMAAEPWSNIAPGINVLLDQSVRDYFYLFTPTQNQNPARINLTQNVPATAYLDDFSLFKYTSIVFEDAKQRSPLFINPTAAAVTVNLLGSYRDLQNNIVSGTMVLPPWSSKILVRTETAANTIWNGTSWSNGVPTVALDAIIAGDYNTQANGTFTAKTLSLNSGVLTVSSGTTLTVENAIANNAGADNFIVQSGGSLIQTGIASNTGPITVQRASAPIVRLDHTLWSSPVSGQNLFSFSPNTLPNRFYTYATSTNTYVNTGLTSSTAFMPGKGYAVRAPNNFPASPAAPWTGTFKGIPNNGSFSFALSVAFEGYNLIGNPYPSAISAVSFVDDPVNASKIDGTLYFYAHSLAMNASGQFPAGTNYATWNKTGHTLATNSSVVPNGTIQTGQGFIVKAVQPGSVSFTNSMRSAGTGPFFRSANSEPEKHRLWLDLSNEDGSVFSQALVGYVSGATLGFDRGYDGLAFGNTGSFISTKIGGSDYAIQARPLPFDASDVVPLSFRAVQAGSYSITLSGMDGVFSGSQDVFLKDNASGILHNLKSGAYAFSSAEGTFDGRFQVVYQNALGTPESVLSPGSIAAFSKAGVLHVESKNMEINSIKAYDVQGRLVYSKSGINAGSIVLEGLQAQNQLLLLQIASSGGAAAIKVIF